MTLPKLSSRIPRLAIAALALASFSAARSIAADAAAGKKLIAEIHNSGFAQAHDTYNGLSSASDGKIYYVLSAQEFDVGAQMFVFDPVSRTIHHCGDLTDACGERGLKAVSQGKSHVNFVEWQGKLYFATHIGYYSIIDDMEKPGIPPPGYKPYPGGHFLAYDMATGQFEHFGTAPHGEGIITMNMDARRGRLYGITWPKGYFCYYDLAGKTLKNLGLFAEQGESGKGPTYRTLCRSLAIDPADGSVYFSVGSGDILRYRYDQDKVETVVGEDLRKDYFGLYDPTCPGHMGYNWRQVFWHPEENVIYGVHGNSGYLFRFDPHSVRVDVLGRLTSLPSQRSGMFDQFSYGYLGFKLGPDHRTIYYLTGGPIYVEGKRVKGKSTTGKGEAKGLEDLHLVTYDIPTGRYSDRGAIFFPDGQRPLYVNSIAIGNDGTVYALSRYTRKGRETTDLMSVRPQ
jgi:hypothetical protein